MIQAEEGANGAEAAAGPSGDASREGGATGAQGFDERMRATAEARRRQMGDAPQVASFGTSPPSPLMLHAAGEL